MAQHNRIPGLTLDSDDFEKARANVAATFPPAMQRVAYS